MSNRHDSRNDGRRRLSALAGVFVVALGCGSEPPDRGAASSLSAGSGGDGGTAGVAGGSGASPTAGQDAGDDVLAAGGAALEPDADVEADAPATEDCESDAAQEGQAPWGCGDGMRDPGSEECDDGLGDLDGLRACSAACGVVDHLVPWDPDVRERRLGGGRHPSAAGNSGQALATVESMLGSESHRIGISTWTQTGRPEGGGWIDGVPEDAGPVLAAIGDGSFALAFVSETIDGDGLGIGLARVAVDGSVTDVAFAANEQVLFAQHSPDILVLGQEVIVGWQDDGTEWGSTVCWRRFNPELLAGGTQHCEPDNGSFRSRPVLASAGGSLVVAWREDGALAVKFDAGVTTILPFEAGQMPPDELPAIIGVDADRVLVVYTEAEGSQLAALVERHQGLVPPGIAVLNPSGPPRHHPSGALASDGIYLAWMRPASSPPADGGWDTQYDELLVQKLVWDGQNLDASAAPISLPRHPAHTPGDQRLPSLVSVPLGPAQGVLAAWEDLLPANFDGHCPYTDVVLELIPTPILRNGGGR